MRITETYKSLIERCRTDFQTELDKVMGSVERNPMFEPTMAIIRVLRVVNTRLNTLENELINREEANAQAQNRFHKCETVSEVIAQAIGAGSTSWVGGTGSAVFDSEEATAISVEATERIEAITKKKRRF